MWPLATDKPKHLLPLAGHPIISYSLRALAAAGIKEVFMVVGFKGEQIASSLGDGSEYGVTIQYLHQRRWTGTASAIEIARESVGNETFLALYGDLLIDQTCVNTVLGKARECSKVMGVVRLKQEGKSEYGIVELKGDDVARIREKPIAKRDSGILINGGIYVLDGDIFRSIKKTSRSARNEYELTTSLQRLIDGGQVVKAAVVAGEGWMDIGRPWDLLGANERILSNLEPQLKGTVESGAVVNGPVFLGDDTVIRSGSYIEGPAYIGEKSAIGPNCRVRPYTSIADEAHVGSFCEVKNSIVMAHSKVPHLSYVGDSVIGEQCNLAAGTITANIRLDEAPIRMRLKGKLTSSGRRKLGAIIGDWVQTGVNTSIMPGVRIGQNSYIGPGVIVYEDVPANRMVLARQPLIMKTRKRRL